MKSINTKPRWHGNPHIADQVLNPPVEGTGLSVIGDSIQQGGLAKYAPFILTPTFFYGTGIGASYPPLFTSGEIINPTNATPATIANYANQTYYASTEHMAGLGYQIKWTLTGETTHTNTGMQYNKLWDVNYTAGQLVGPAVDTIPSGDWYHGQQITFRAIFLRQDTSPTNLVRLRVGIGNTLVAETGAFDLTVSNEASGLYVIADITYTGRKTTPADVMPFISIMPNTAATAGQTIVLLGTTIFRTNRAYGLVFVDGSVSGSGIGYVPDANTNWDDHDALLPAAWNILNVVPIDVVMIQLGANGQGIGSKANYKAAMQSLMADMLAARPTLNFILLSTYESNSNANTALSEYADALYEIADAEGPAGHVLFVNMFREAGQYNVLYYGGANATYLSDGVHPKPPQGNWYFWQVINGILKEAQQYVTTNAIETTYARGAVVSTTGLTAMYGG